jgi:hypothetical protein
MIAAHLRKRRPKPHATWHLDEVADKARPSLDEREVERMNRTIKRYFYETHNELRAYLSTPITSPEGSRPSEASPRAKPGLHSRKDSQSARSRKRRN